MKLFSFWATPCIVSVGGWVVVGDGGVVCKRVHQNHYVIGIVCICGCDQLWLKGCRGVA